MNPENEFPEVPGLVKANDKDLGREEGVYLDPSYIRKVAFKRRYWDTEVEAPIKSEIMTLTYFDASTESFEKTPEEYITFVRALGEAKLALTGSLMVQKLMARVLAAKSAEEAADTAKRAWEARQQEERREEEERRQRAQNEEQERKQREEQIRIANE